VKQLHVLLVDRSEDFMDAVSDWLTSDPMLRVVGTIGRGREAVECVVRENPDLVLVDTTLPDLNGFDVARSIKSLSDPPMVVLVAFHDSETARAAAQAAGADDLIAKSDVTSGLEAVVGTLVAKRANGSMGDRPRTVTSELVGWRPGQVTGDGVGVPRPSVGPTKQTEEG
jgi:DNA-binding response OmpR family regulator